MATATPVAVVDALQSLLEAEKNSIFNFMSADSPYLTRAEPSLRQTLDGMMRANVRRSEEVRELIKHLGGPARARGGTPDEAYLTYLSLKFLLPKLVDAKELCIHRHKTTLKSVGDAPDDVRAALARHLLELKGELSVLEAERAKVLAAR